MVVAWAELCCIAGNASVAVASAATAAAAVLIETALRIRASRADGIHGWATCNCLVGVVRAAPTNFATRGTRLILVLQSTLAFSAFCLPALV